MNRKDLLYLMGILAVSALLVANLVRPTAPHAFEVPDARGSVPVNISASGDSAWAIIGNKVYFLSLRARTELPSGQRSINIIDSRNLEE